MEFIKPIRNRVNYVFTKLNQLTVKHFFIYLFIGTLAMLPIAIIIPSPSTIAITYLIPPRITAPILYIFNPNFDFTPNQQMALFKRYYNAYPQYQHTKSFKAENTPNELHASFIIQTLLDKAEASRYHFTQTAKSILATKIQEYHHFNYQKYPNLSLHGMDIWRLFIDGQRQNKEKGWAGFERREPNCMQAIYNAWYWMLTSNDTKSTIYEPLTQTYIKHLHKIITSHKPNQFLSGKYKITNNYHTLCNACTLLGINEYIQKITNQDPDLGLKFINNNLALTSRNHNITNKVQKTLDTYEHEIAIYAQDPLKIIQAILKMTSHLGHIHPFMDGNGRTIITLLLNKELMRHHFPPVILKEPLQVVSGHSQAELLIEITKGWDNFFEVATTGRLYKGPTTEEFIAKNRAKDVKYPIKFA